jgi:uncharacterized membrane protein YjjP (DUF1212 family)
MVTASAVESFVVGVAFVCFAVMARDGWWVTVGAFAAALLLVTRDQIRDRRLRSAK